MLRGYERAALTLNFIRALVDGGFADLHHPEYWDLAFVGDSPHAAEYQRIVRGRSASRSSSSRRIDRRADAQHAAGSTSTPATRGCICPTSRRRPRFLRTRPAGTTCRRTSRGSACAPRELDGAHVEYFRGIANPIGVKVGPRDEPTSSCGSCSTCSNPNNEPGRLTLIHRFGAKQDRGPPAAAGRGGAARGPDRAVGAAIRCTATPRPRRAASRPAASTTSSASSSQAFEHPPASSARYLGGVHFELTGEDVTECIGGARGLTEADLERAYKSQVDPRLNYEQALEMAMLIGGRLQTHD